ncbi:hypothetical protein [Leuconostoc mesenteroides]|uniref:hypothetical protein n=1 Tax=Leuconostoc mesenteroides TaxID=1245 RepID=UPI0021A63954|nr:hypothetical protein [Leuconostoc mesenteroides]
MKTQLINGYWTATSFTDKLNTALAELEANGHEIVEVQYAHKSIIRTIFYLGLN